MFCDFYTLLCHLKLSDMSSPAHVFIFVISHASMSFQRSSLLICHLPSLLPRDIIPQSCHPHPPSCPSTISLPLVNLILSCCCSSSSCWPFPLTNTPLANNRETGILWCVSIFILFLFIQHSFQKIIEKEVFPQMEYQTLFKCLPSKPNEKWIQLSVFRIVGHVSWPIYDYNKAWILYVKGSKIYLTVYLFREDVCFSVCVGV